MINENTQSAGSSSNDSNLVPVADVAKRFHGKFRSRGTERLFNEGDLYQAMLNAGKRGILEIVEILGSGRTSLYVDPDKAALFLKAYGASAENVLEPIPGDSWGNPSEVAVKFLLSKPVDPSSGKIATFNQVYNRLQSGAERGYYLKEKVAPNKVMMGLKGMIKHLDRCFPESALKATLKETPVEETPVKETQISDLDAIWDFNEKNELIEDLLEVVVHTANCLAAAAAEANLTYKFSLLEQAHEWAEIGMEVVNGTPYEAVLKKLLSNISSMGKAA